MRTIKEFLPVMLIKGEETYLIDQRLSALLAAMQEQDGESPELINLNGEEIQPSELQEYLVEIPLFAHRRVVLMKRPKWMENSRGKRGQNIKDFESLIISFLARSSSMQHLIITSSAAASSKTLIDTLKKAEAIEEIPGYDSRQLVSWAEREFQKRGIKIEKTALQSLATSGRDMYYLINEIERLSLCHRERTVTIEDLMMDPEISDFNVFRMTDALLRKNAKEALEAGLILLQKGDPLPVIIQVIAREFILLGKVQALSEQGFSSQEMVSSLGQKSFRIRKMLAGQRLYNKEAIALVFSLLYELDRAIKTTTQDERLLLENFIIEICQA